MLEPLLSLVSFCPFYTSWSRSVIHSIAAVHWIILIRIIADVQYMLERTYPTRAIDTFESPRCSIQFCSTHSSTARFVFVLNGSHQAIEYRKKGLITHLIETNFW